jgi:hydrogenase maturation protease
MRIAVIGLGNLMRTDDAVGMLAAHALQTDKRLPKGVGVIEGGTLGLDLLYPLDGVSHLLAIDAIDAGAAPGTILRYSKHEIANLPISKSVHLLGFTDLFGAMRLTGREPEYVVVLGVQPGVIGWGTELTETVAAAFPQLIERAVEQVAQWSGALALEGMRAGCTCLDLQLEEAFRR